MFKIDLPPESGRWETTEPVDYAALKAQLAAITAERDNLRERLGAVNGLLSEVGSGTCSDCELKNGLCIHQRARTLLTTPPDAQDAETEPE